MLPILRMSKSTKKRSSDSSACVARNDWNPSPSRIFYVLQPYLYQMCCCSLAAVPFRDFLCLFGLMDTVTELENAVVSKVLHQAGRGCFILLERQTFISRIIFSSCKYFLAQSNEEGLILALCDSQELILWY